MLVNNPTTIPPDEQERFSKYLYCYPVGSIIIQEGQDDNGIYLLREGTVAVDRGKATQIATIESVNFFGEMAMILKARRTATIRVISTKAVVYKFQSFDLHAIYNNPAWSELLITRLCANLAEVDKRVEGIARDKQRLSNKMSNLVDQGSMLCAELLSLQSDLTEDTTDNTRDWKLVHRMQELSENFPKTR